MSGASFSIVICSIDAARYARVTALYRALFAGTAFEIIGIHDARSLAEAYNRAAARATGDIVVFSHDDIDIASTGMPGALTRAAAALDVIGIVGTSRLVDAFWPTAGHPWLHGWMSMPSRNGPGYYVHVYGVDAAITPGLQAIDGMLFAVRRPVLQAIAFDAATFDGFHGYDVDFSCTACLAGWRVGITAEIAVIHESGGDFGSGWETYRTRFATKYEGRLAPASGAKPWSMARVLLPSKDAILRQMTPARLVAITAQLRAKAAPRPE